MEHNLMYTASNYFWGMVGYYVGALIVMWYIRWLLVKIPYRHVCNLLCLLFVAVLFTPVKAYQDAELAHLAPAFLVYAFESIVSESSQDPTRALMPIVFVFLILLAGYAGLLWWLHRRRQADPEALQQPNEQVDASEPPPETPPKAQEETA